VFVDGNIRHCILISLKFKHNSIYQYFLLKNGYFPWYCWAKLRHDQGRGALIGGGRLLEYLRYMYIIAIHAFFYTFIHTFKCLWLLSVRTLERAEPNTHSYLTPRMASRVAGPVKCETGSLEQNFKVKRWKKEVMQ
jgi:hypothetical protein